MAKHWYVLGVGAIGGLFASRLQRGGARVTALSHRDHNPCIDLTILYPEGPVSTEIPQQHVDCASQIHYLLVCTKSWATRSAIESVRHALAPDTVVVIMGNGMGIGENVATLVPVDIVMGSTTAGCRRESAGKLVLSGEGETQLGWLAGTGPVPEWTALWASAVPGFRWQQDIAPVLLAKTALNAVINPLTAVHQIPNGQLLEPDFLTLTQALTREVQALLRALNAEDLAEQLPDRVRQVCAATADNHSSMRQDVASGRRTELAAIVGWWFDQIGRDRASQLAPQLTALAREIEQSERRVTD